MDFAFFKYENIFLKFKLQIYFSKYENILLQHFFFSRNICYGVGYGIVETLSSPAHFTIGIDIFNL